MWQEAQIGTAFIRATSRALMRGIALLLLLTHSSWAGIICSCSHQDEFEHSCCYTAQHDDKTIEAGQEADTHSSHCTIEEMPAPAQLDNQPQSVTVCCYPGQQASAQTIAISSTKELSVENTQLPIQIGAQAVIASESIYIYPHRHSRPLYLAFSCWLI
jgi:hypothetical protein